MERTQGVGGESRVDRPGELLQTIPLAKLFELSDSGQLPKKIGYDDCAYKYLPAAWGDSDARKKLIKVRDLPTMCSGLQAKDMGIRDLDMALALPVVNPAETVDQYSSASTMLEEMVIENASGQSLSSFFRRHISDPIGTESVRLWDARGAAGYAFMHTRDLARFGYLVLRNGAWDNGSGVRQVVRPDLIAKCAQWPKFLSSVTDGPGNNTRWLTADDPPSHFLHTWHGWWVNWSPDWPSSMPAVWPAVPKDAFWMSGYGKDVCFVIPSLDMIIAHQTERGRLEETLNAHPEFFPTLLSKVMAAVVTTSASPPAQSAETVERWDTYERSFSTARSYANPFQDVGVTVTFTHATGKSIRVAGFHDGGLLWKVRFMPTDLGKWTYATSSSDEGLNGKTGTLTCVAPAKPRLHGPLRAQGHHFVHADGTPRFLISTRLSCQFASPHAWQLLVAFLQASRINRVLFMMPGVDSQKSPVFNQRHLFASGPDYTRYNIEAFRAIDAFSNVMPVLGNEIELKTTAYKDREFDLKSHAWANEMGTLLKSQTVFGQPVSVHNPSWHEFAINPSYFSLLKDWPFASWTDFILKQVQVGSIGIASAMSDAVPQPKTPTYDERAYARRNQLLVDLRRFGQPVIDEEPGYDMGGTASAWNSQTPDTMRRTIWTAAVAGAYTVWGSTATYETGDPLPAMRGSATPPYLRVLHDVMTGLPYQEMEPRNELVTPGGVALNGEAWRTNYALGKPGEAYLVYSLRGGAGEIRLAPGRYTASRVDPRDGTQTALGTVSAGNVSFSLPQGDWGLIYRSTAADHRKSPSGSQWRSLPLIAGGKIDTAWAQVGWGGFVVDAGALRTECDQRGMGLLFYKPEKFGDCQIRVVYPYHFGKLNATTRNQMRFIMTRARSLQPDIGLIGIYQAFGGGEELNSPQWKDMPTPEQVREDMLSFYDWGADGVMAFIYHWRGMSPKEPQGLDAVPEVRDMIGRSNREILAGEIKRTMPPVGKREWLSILAGPEATPSPGGKPAYNFDDPAKLASLVKGRPNRLSAERFAVEGRSYPLKVSFPAWNKADPKSDRWPIAQFAAGDLTTTDGSQVGALEQPIYNPGDETITVLISLEDTAKGWWQRSVEIPPRVPMLLRVPMDEARLSIDPGHIQRWLLWEADPPTAIQFRLGTPMLAPARK